MKPLFCIIKTWEIVWNGYCTCSKLLYMLKWHFNAIFPSQIWWFWKKLVNIPILKVYAETQHVSNGNRKLPIVLSFDLSGNMWLYLLTYCQKCDDDMSQRPKIELWYQMGGLACRRTSLLTKRWTAGTYIKLFIGSIYANEYYDNPSIGVAFPYSSHILSFPPI